MMIDFLDLFGTAVFAISGTLAAGRKRMDIFGATVVAMVTAVGGGTIRDLLLGNQPVFWIARPVYLLVIVCAAVLAFGYAAVIRHHQRPLLFADALGLAVFTVIGMQIAQGRDVHWAVAIMMGVMTGAAGGILRDILCNEVPLILCREVYATASLIGAASILGLKQAHVNPQVAVVLAILIVFAIRMAAIHWHLSLPVLRVPDDSPREARHCVEKNDD